MSYQSKKRKKSKLNQLKFFIELVLIKFFNKIKNRVKKTKKGEEPMRLFKTRKTMEFLRIRNKIIRSNNLKINEWVDEYLDRCLINGEPVNILTQWCISKDLEERFRKQNNKFVLTRKERKLFEKELPEIISVFKENGFDLNWWITFNRSYLDTGRISKELEDKYKRMIIDLAEKIDDVLILDWEEDVLRGRPRPNKEVLENLEQFISSEAFRIELERHSKWTKEEAGLKQSDEELKQDVRFQIACEIEEGRFLINEQLFSKSKEFILIPLEVPERYDFFTVLANDFKERIVSVLSCYPWRVK